ncbi:hypothetical protein C5S35_00265 [Candidatus Methanophagaceae archaeon]|nr:hypothetical protein C5S35_00265 [Methanophagales archaeon]
MNKERKRIPSGGRRRDMSSTNDQHIEDLDTALKMFREFPNFQLKELLFLPTILYIFAKCFELNTIHLNIIISPFLILLFLQLTTHILIEYKKLKLLFKTIIFP